MRPESITGGRRVSWIALAAVLIIPLLSVGALFGLTAKDAATSVEAAIVNLDEPATLNDQLVPLGRQLAAAMVDRDGENVSWTLADAKSAQDGLASGEFSAVVVIPEGFSTAATSYADNDAASARQATIRVQVSENSPVTDAAVAQEVARLATATINETLTEGYLDGIYVGFNEVGEQFTTIVDGAQQLGDGGADLADGTSQSAEGAVQLADGMTQLSLGGTELASGGTELATGAGTFASGVTEFTSGVGQFADGVVELDAGIQQLDNQLPQLTDGVDELATGADQLLSGIPDFADGAAQAIEGVGSLKWGLDQVIAGLDQPQDYSGLNQLASGAASLSSGLGAVDDSLQQLADPAAPLPADVSATGSDLISQYTCPAGVDAATCQLLEQAYSQGVGSGLTAGYKGGVGTASTMLNTADATGLTLLGGAQQLSAGLDQLATDLPATTQAQGAALKAALQEISDGADTLITEAQPIVDSAPEVGAGASQLLSGINQLNEEAGALPDGVSQLADGSSQLASSASELSTGGSQLSAGADDLSSGVSQYVSGVNEYVVGVQSAAAGTQSLADGLVLLDVGTQQLADGLDTFATELDSGADQVPSYSQLQRETLSSVVASPVAQSDGLIDSGRTALVALLLVGGLWLGAFVAFIVVRPVPSTVVTSSASSVALWAQTVGAPAAVLAALGVALGVVGAGVVPLTTTTTLGLCAALAALGVAFVLANHALAGWLGTIGRGISLVLLAVTVALGLSSSVTGWAGTVAQLSPAQNGMLLVRTIISDGSGLNGLIGGAILLAAIMGALSLLAISTRRRVSAARYRRQLAQAA